MTTLPAAFIARLHTILAASAFLTAFFVGCTLHYKKIVKNSVAGYPDEWFPSVSATIGDWYPERNLFQILIAITSGPRFSLVLFQYYLHRTSTSSLPTLVFLFGILRTLTCGGWVYITSTDDHDIHDVMMIVYIICNIPWMLVGSTTTPVSRVQVRKRRRIVAGVFFATLIPLVYFFIQHKVYRIPGAYTSYAFCEWALIFLDVLYDSISEQEFRETGLQISLTTSSKSTPDDLSTPNAMFTVTTVKDSPVNVAKFPSSKARDDATEVALSHATSQNEKAAKCRAQRWRELSSFLSDIYLSCVFWSLFTALIPTLFYFSVWQLGIAGSELALLSVVSPILLSLSLPSNPLSPSMTLVDFVKTRRGQVVLQSAALLGIVAYAVPSPSVRLLLVGAGNIAAMMKQAPLWAGLVEGQTDVGYQAIVTGLGVLLSALSKQANRANNPIWPFINHKAEGWNRTGLLLAVLSTYDLATRPIFEPESSAAAATPQSRPSLLGALPLGSLLFTICNLLGDSSTLVAWSWTGYENQLPRGPVPHLHGSLTIIAMSVGLCLALYSTIRQQNRNHSFLRSHWWYIIGAALMYVMYTYRNWPGYAGGFGVALWLMSVLPVVFESAAEVVRAGRTMAKTYASAMFFYCVMHVAGVFTVAYAFVPGGVYLRERTDLILIIPMVVLLPVFRLPFLRPPSLSTVSLSSSNLSSKYESHTRILLLVITFLSLLTTVYRLPRAPPTPFKPGPRIVNSGIWTVHFGIDNEGHDSQRGIMSLIKDMKLDIVGLLETDLQRPAFGHRDVSRLIVEEMNYNVDAGPGPNSHTWGAVLLTKFPIVSTKHHLLPSPHGELAPAIEAVLDVYGTEVLVVVAHNGQEEDALDRELQSTELARIMANSTRPTIFLGYVVTKPLMPRPAPYGILVGEGRMHDIDMDDPDRWCEYILYRGLYRTSYARVSRGIITDTELQIGQFVLPKHGHNVTNDSVEARYIRSRREDLPEDHWFPAEYYGNEDQGGVNGHFYHVFNTPLYYALPAGAIV